MASNEWVTNSCLTERVELHGSIFLGGISWLRSLGGGGLSGGRVSRGRLVHRPVEHRLWLLVNWLVDWLVGRLGGGLVSRLRLVPVIEATAKCGSRLI